MRNAWLDGEGPLVDERRFTSWAEPGWHSWNAYSPELEFCELAATIADHVDGVVIETGAGQGYITRRVGEVAYPYYVYESAPHLRRVIPDDYTVIDEPTPDGGELAICELLIVDSGMEYRRPEIARWLEHAPDTSLLLMHDAGNGHERNNVYTHNQYWSMVTDLGIPGIKYKNPRGAFLGWKTEPDADYLDWLLSLMDNEYPYE